MLRGQTKEPYYRMMLVTRYSYRTQSNNDMCCALAENGEAE